MVTTNVGAGLQGTLQAGAKGGAAIDLSEVSIKKSDGLGIDVTKSRSDVYQEIPASRGQGRA